MNLTDLLAREELRLTALTGPFPKPVEGGYASDLLSDVLAHTRAGYLWVTIQTNRNVAAVAGLQDLAGVVIAHGRQPQQDLLDLAGAERVNVMVTPLSTYEIVGRLYGLGIR